MLWGGALGSLAAFLWLAGLAARGHWFAVDQTTRDAVALLRDSRLDAGMQALTVLGHGPALTALTVLASLLLWHAARRWWALALPGLMAGTGALQFLAKWAVDRPRPNLAPWGFPSGHVLSLVVFFGLVAYWLCTSAIKQYWQVAGGVGGAGIVLAVAFSRLYLEAHWLSDVVAGFLLGLAYLFLVLWLSQRLQLRQAGLIAAAPASPAGTAALSTTHTEGIAQTSA